MHNTYDMAQSSESNDFDRRSVLKTGLTAGAAAAATGATGLGTGTGREAVERKQ